jgi:hypothetical protein
VRHTYPPEYDYPAYCVVCRRTMEVPDGCDCPECPVCGEFGAPSCYEQGHLQPLPDSVQAFCDHIGIEPVKDALRAIDKCNAESICVQTHDRQEATWRSEAALAELKPWTRLRYVIVEGDMPTSYPDYSDYSWRRCSEAGNWAQLDRFREEFNVELDATRPWCRNCKHPLRAHDPAGKCLFGPGRYESDDDF